MRVLLFLSICIVAALGYTRYNATNSNIRHIGRYVTNSAGAIQYDWTGFQTAFDFSGTSLRLQFSGRVRINLNIDGVTQLINLTNFNGATQNFTITGLSNQNHQLYMIKRTEASFGVVTFQAVYLDNSGILKPPTSSLAPKAGAVKIQFIGDSITCGYGNLDPFPCVQTAENEDGSRAWGGLVGAYFKSEFHITSWSGKGVVRNYNENITVNPSPNPMPSLFKRTLGTDSNSVYDFSFVPDIIVINLGTNDFSTKGAPSQQLYESGYKNFTDFLKNKYSSNKNLKFFMACGPLQSTATCPYVKNVANATGGTYVDLTGIIKANNATYLGCDSHPSLLSHQIMANRTINALQPVINALYSTTGRLTTGKKTTPSGATSTSGTTENTSSSGGSTSSSGGSTSSSGGSTSSSGGSTSSSGGSTSSSGGSISSGGGSTSSGGGSTSDAKVLTTAVGNPTSLETPLSTETANLISEASKNMMGMAILFMSLLLIVQ